MTSWFSDVLPPWAAIAVVSVLIMAVGYLAGLLLRVVVGRRLAVFASRTKAGWDDVVAAALSRQVPLWGLLVGVYVAAGQWGLSNEAETTLHKILIVLVGVSATVAAAGLAASLVRDYGRQVHSELPVTSLTENVVRIVVGILGTMMILHGLGVSIAPLLTALGVGGLAVALALQDTLANLFAGIHISLAGQLRVGDYVRLDSGEEGYLVDIAWRSAQIRMLANNVILVPNAKLAQAIVTNYALPEKEMSVLVQVGVDYGSDLAHVERVTIEVGRETLQSVAGGVETFDPFIRYHTFGDSSIDFSVILRAKEFVDQYLLKHEFVKRLHQRYEREGITIPFPIRTLVAREGGLQIARDSAA